MNIGKTIHIVRSRNPQLVGKRGTVIDETSQTITLSNGKQLIKDHITFEETP